MPERTTIVVTSSGFVEHIPPAVPQAHDYPIRLPMHDEYSPYEVDGRDLGLSCALQSVYEW